MNAAAYAGMCRVVFTSSYGTVHMNLHQTPEDTVYEDCCIDMHFSRKTDVWIYGTPLFLSPLSLSRSLPICLMLYIYIYGWLLLCSLFFITVVSQNRYCCTKMMAKQTAWEISRERGLNLVVVVPPVKFGLMLQPAQNASCMQFTKYFMVRNKAFANAVQTYVLVKD